MQHVNVVARDLNDYRPMHQPERNLPVYANLADTLANVRTCPDDVVAHALAVCAGYAYGEADTVSSMMARLGLERNHCLMVKESVDAMYICSTAFLVQSQCGRVVLLCYRGTEPANLINWLTDADTSPSAVAFFRSSQHPGDVHAGFYRNVRATRYAVVGALQRALRGESVLEPEDGGAVRRMPNELRALYVTGHSLGGAMAAMMGVMIATEPDYQRLAARLKGVYTFGQPMIGNPSFAESCERFTSSSVHLLRDHVVRYVFRGDPVPALPPALAGAYAHFGREVQLGVAAGRFRASEAMVSTPQMLAAEALQLLPAAAAPATVFRDVSFRYGPADHGPQHYIDALTPGMVKTTEFGDDVLTPVERPATRLAWAVELVQQLARNGVARARRAAEPLLHGERDQVRHLDLVEAPTPLRPPDGGMLERNIG